MDLKKVNEILANNSKKFLDVIMNIRENTRISSITQNESNISMFEPANDEYFKYSYFEKQLEYKIYEFLINKNLFDLLKLNNVNFCVANRSISVEYKKHFFGLHKIRIETEWNYGRDNVEWLEERLLCQFIIEKDSERIGYRYTSLDRNLLYPNSFIDEIRENRLNRIIILDMKLENGEKSDSHFDIEQKYKDLVSRLKYSEFFIELFGQEIYDLYYEKVKKTISEANDIIGFQTIPSMSLRYMSEFKDKENNDLEQLDYECMHFEVIDEKKLIEKLKDKYKSESKAKKIIDRTCKNIDIKDKQTIKNNFIDKGLYKCLLGEEDFAISFLTSEYLYELFKNNNNHNIDFTWIITGYIKSVEQLLYKIMQSELKNSHDEQLWIKLDNNKTKIVNDNKIKFDKSNTSDCPYNNKIKQVIFKKDYESCFDISLGSLRHFFIDNKNGWNVNSETIDTIEAILNIYTQEDRNEHFHKDNITSFDDVPKIRDNTVFVMSLLLGGYNIQIFDLNCYDNEYNKLFRCIMNIPPHVKEYYLVFNGVEYKAIKLYDQSEIEYTENGNIISDIKFIKVNDFSIGDYKQFIENADLRDYIIVNNNNMPEKVYLNLYNGIKKVIFERK